MKFQGSKSRIARDILPIILKGRGKDQWYVEPFAGGMNTVQYVGGKVIASDANEYLIAMWRALQDGREFPRSISKSDYNFQRALWHNGIGDKAMIGWVGFMASFNGRFFCGGYSGHEVKVNGGTRDYITESICNIMRQVPKIGNVTFLSSDYKALLIPPHSIIYCDPPYKGRKDYDCKIDHEAFWQWCREKAAEGHRVYVSEYEAPKDFKCVWAKKTIVSMHQRNTKRPTEKLFTIKQNNNV